MNAPDRDEARSLYERGRRAARDGRQGDALAFFEQVISRYGDATEAWLSELVGQALYGKAYSLEKIEREDEALVLYDEIIERFGSSERTEVQAQLARALYQRGEVLARRGRTDEALATWDDLLARYRDATEPELLRRVAGALDRKAAAFRRLERLDEAAQAYDEIIVRFADSEFAPMRHQADLALSNKAFVLLVQGRYDEAIVVAKGAIGRLDDSNDPRSLAIAVLNLGGALIKQERLGEAMDVYDALIERLDRPEAARLRSQLILATSNRVEVLAMLGRTDDAMVLYAELIERFRDDVPRAFRDNAERNEHDEGATAFVAGMRFKEAVALAELERDTESLAVLNNLIDRFGDEDDDEVRRVLALARDYRAQLLADSD